MGRVDNGGVSSGRGTGKEVTFYALNLTFVVYVGRREGVPTTTHDDRTRTTELRRRIRGVSRTLRPPQQSIKVSPPLVTSLLNFRTNHRGPDY